MTEPVDLYGLDADGLAQLLATWGHKKFRAKQLHGWLYEQGCRDFDAMGNLPGALRAQLAERAVAGAAEVAAEQQSKDGTIKRLYRLPDDKLIEAVLMPYADGRRTACISSQAGCAMGCVFCATGQMGFDRHLTAGEIFGQAARFAAECTQRGERLSNIVLMGMGEPFHNYDAVLEAIGRIMGDLGIGARRITLSTVGLVPRIRQFAQEGLQVTLAISLHAATDEERTALLPINKRWPLAEVIDACHEYVGRTGRRVTFEWALIAGQNDSPATARRLGRLLQGLTCHVNLIPLNPTGGYAGGPSQADAVERFTAELGRFGVPATVRMRRGVDIDAGCGQLRDRVLGRGL